MHIEAHHMETPIVIPISTSDIFFLTGNILQASDREAYPQPVLKTRCGAGFRVCPGAWYIPCITFCLKIRRFGVDARYSSCEIIVLTESDLE